MNKIKKLKEKNEVVIRELKCLGQYYRNDWSFFDGRTLRDELNRLTAFIDNEELRDFTEFSEGLEEQEQEQLYHRK